MTVTQPTTAAAAVPNLQVHKGTVKLVLSGDSLVIRGVPRGGPPPEKTIAFSSISAPRLARRPNPNDDSGGGGTQDEPFAWEAREFVRQKCVGKDVFFTLDPRGGGASSREYGTVYLGSDISTAENLSESLVAAGLADVRGAASGSDAVNRMKELEESAKAAGKGKHGAPAEQSAHVRSITWGFEGAAEARTFVDKMKQAPLNAVIEFVRDGSTYRIILPEQGHLHLTLMLSGIRCPSYTLGPGGVPQSPDPFSLEARYFAEVRLLQRDVQVVLESTNNNNVVGSVLHPNGNIAELLLREGFAKCVDWSLALATAGRETLRAAEKVAKDKRLRVWSGYVEPDRGSLADRQFTAKVLEINMADALTVRRGDGRDQKIWLASIRQPRPEDGGQDKENRVAPGRQFRPLYDIPYMFEAREFLRKRLVGKKVNITVDYVQKARTDAGTPNLPERTMCTVVVNGQNVAEALVAKGLASVVRYRADDENRSSFYDALLAAEAKAEKTRLGIHSMKRGENEPPNKDPPVVRVQDLQGDASKSRNFLNSLKRAGKVEAVVEYIPTGSRVRAFIPKETCLMTLLFTGIDCPRAGRSDAEKGDPFGNEARDFVKNACLQRDVQLEVESMDRAGNFIGVLTVDGRNLAVELVRAGLAGVHPTAERANCFKQLCDAEEEAKKAKRKMWENWTPEQEVDTTAEGTDDAAPAATPNGDVAGGSKSSSTNRNPLQSVVVTELDAEKLRIWVQRVDQGAKLEELMTEMRADLSENPAIAGTYNPQKGDICAARFSADKQWYRAKVENAKNRENIEVLFIDFGNRETTTASALTQLPETFKSHPAGAKEYALAYISIPTDADYLATCADGLRMALGERGGRVDIGVEYRDQGMECVRLVDKESKEDITLDLITNGLVVADAPPRYQRSMGQKYMDAMEKAKKSRSNIWRYGDFTGTDF